MSELSEIARRCDEAVARARRELVAAVREAHAGGMTQAEIAQEIGRSQPEVSRLLRFHGTGPRAAALRKHRADIIWLVKEAGGSNVRVFGSVATGEDGPDSDIDLLFDPVAPIGLMGLARLQRRIGDVVGFDVDIVPEDDLIPVIKERVRRQAVSL